MHVKEARSPSSVPPGRPWQSCQLSMDDVFLIGIYAPLQTQMQLCRRTQNAPRRLLLRYRKSSEMNVNSVFALVKHSAFPKCFHEWLMLQVTVVSTFSRPLQKVLSECQDRRSCHIPVFSPVFGQDPCPLTSKYLLVSYKCRPGRPLTC